MLEPTGANYEASAGSVTAPKALAAWELSHFIKMMITFRYLQCVIMNVFFMSLMLKLTFPLIVNSAIIMRINIANIPIMSPLSKNSGTKYTHRVNDKYPKI